MKRKLGLLVSLLILVLVIAGCEKIGLGSIVVASVNGERITEKTLNARVEEMAILYDVDLTSADGQEIKAYLQEEVLNSLVYETFIIQEAKKQKISAAKSEINERLQMFKDNFVDEAAYKEYLKLLKLKEGEIKKRLERELLTEKLFAQVTADITETSQDARKFYNENKEAYLIPEQIQVRHILLKTEADALDIIKRLDKGENFTDLVLEKSILPSAKQDEGLSDFFIRDAAYIDNLGDDTVIPQFFEAAFNLKNVGDYTKTPVKTVHGYHVIKLESREKEQQLTFDEVEELIEQELLLQEKNLKFEEYTSELIKEANIIINFPTDDALDLEEGKTSQSDDDGKTKDPEPEAE
jgi:foldase protein PrsA